MILFVEARQGYMNFLQLKIGTSLSTIDPRKFAVAVAQSAQDLTRTHTPNHTCLALRLYYSKSSLPILNGTSDGHAWHAILQKCVTFANFSICSFGAHADVVRARIDYIRSRFGNAVRAQVLAWPLVFDLFGPYLVNLFYFYSVMVPPCLYSGFFWLVFGTSFPVRCVTFLVPHEHNNA